MYVPAAVPAAFFEQADTPGGSWPWFDSWMASRLIAPDRLKQAQFVFGIPARPCHNCFGSQNIGRPGKAKQRFFCWSLPFEHRKLAIATNARMITNGVVGR